MLRDTMPLPPIFVISLPNSPRRAVINQRLSSLKIDFEFIDAINGKELSETELKHIDREWYVKHFKGHHPMLLGEIGCSLSHIKVYHKIVNENIKEAIILEDDAIVSHYFKRIVADALDKVPQRKQILFLDHGKGKFWFFKRKLKEGYHLVRYRYPSKNSIRTIMRATAYYLTFEGAKLLLENAYPVRMPADYLTGAIQMTGIKAYGIEPSCVFVSAESEIDSIEQRNNRKEDNENIKK